MGIVTGLAHTATLELFSKFKAWTWGPSQSEAFELVKAELSKPTTLALYDPAASTKVSVDVSSHGLGAVLLQQTNTVWQLVVFAPRSMTETEH